MYIVLRSGGIRRVIYHTTILPYGEWRGIMISVNNIWVDKGGFGTESTVVPVELPTAIDLTSHAGDRCPSLVGVLGC